MIKEFSYNNIPVLFNLTNENVFINGTQMAKPFNKKPNDFLKTQTTKEFINALSASKKIEATNLVRVVNGGNNFGTWFHEDVALEFARWLSPMFAIWCNERIKELLSQGYTKLDNISRKDLAQMLLDAETAKEKALKYSEGLQTQLKIQQPKVEFFNQVVKSTGLLDLNQTAKLIGIGRNKMCDKLRLVKVFFKGTQPYQRYIDLEYFKLKERNFLLPEGDIGISTKTYVTQKGLSFLYRKFQYSKFSLSELKSKRYV